MTKSEIENMLLDIINNGAEYECRPIGKCSHCVKCRLCDWKDYKLGDEIHDDYEYREKEKWCVIRIECCPDYIITLKNEHNKNETYFESYQKEECEKWIDDFKIVIHNNLVSDFKNKVRCCDFSNISNECLEKMIDMLDGDI